MNPLHLFRKSKLRHQKYPQAHMTWASSQLGSRVTRTGVFLRKRLWLWPIIAVVLLSIVGFTARSAIESTMKRNLASSLETLLTVEAGMLENWFLAHQSIAASMANDLNVRQSIYQLLDPGGAQSHARNEARENMEQPLQDQLAAAMESHDYVGYFVADKSQRILAASDPVLQGEVKRTEFQEFIRLALDGATVVCPPFASQLLLKNRAGELSLGEPTMFVCAPVRDASFQVVAALALQIEPEREFTRILQLARLGESGETYAFDKEGRMVSNSRFDEDLILMGLLPDQANSRSILKVLVRDPQGDVTAGYRPKVRRAQLPLTRMAADAIAGNANVDVEGYRDYRGVPVVGAWTWLPQHRIGIATEVDKAEAFRPLAILQKTFWFLYALLILSSIAIFGFTLVVAKLQRQAREAVAEAKQLGQYKLEKKLGEGAMGAVYMAHHAMLRRPTAVKMLHVHKIDEDATKRFEREVQITCKLMHPNTIAIYDYGRTPEGVFYYAMEFLDGIDLQQLVNDYGPQPESRVIHILLQMCGSLYEAHCEGLVHRDIKPANVMLNRRGRQSDVVKVLDFGLVKAIDDRQRAHRTTTDAMVGTPHYISPEAIQTPLGVDARSDLYAVGAVGYFLLTGETLFEASSLADLFQKHATEVPIPPSQRLGKPVSTEVENTLLACLEKLPANRPQTARDLETHLRKSPAYNQWTRADGDAWWDRHQRNSAQPAADQSISLIGSIDLAIPSDVDDQELRMQPEEEENT